MSGFVKTPIEREVEILRHRLDQLEKRVDEPLKTETPKIQRIGVYDYDSLVECLRANFETALPDWNGTTDPQGMMQIMAATIQRYRRIHDA